jgi:Fungal specific transcription factor domain
MIGLALRIATSMGLHRDGSEVGHSPFESEIRRRLWWHLMMIDIRSSEDFASNPSPYTTNRVRVPANLNDEDMDPNSKIDYTSKIGLTEMSPSLIRFEGCQFILSCMAIGQQGQHQCHRCDGNTSTEETPPCSIIPVEVIEKFERDLHAKFMKFADADLSLPRNRLVLSMARLALLKMKVLLGVFHLRKGKMAMQVETAKYADEMFDNSVHLLEAQADLQNGEDFANWFWLLKNYNQWHSMAIILTQLLSEINKMTNPTEATLPSNLRRAWSIADLTFQQSEAVGIYDKMWGPLGSLRKKVADKLRGRPIEEESPPALNFDSSTPSSGMEEVDWTLPSVWTDFGSTPWVDFGSNPQTNVSSSAGMVSEPWPMYFPTNLFTGSGL